MSSKEESTDSGTSKFSKIWDWCKGICKKWGSVIGNFITTYGYIIMILSFFLILITSEKFTLNVNSYKIIATFCSIIIGFGFNAYFNLIKLDINSLNLINSKIRTGLMNQSGALKENYEKSNEVILDKLEKLETIDKELIKIKNVILSEMKFFIFFSFFLLCLSIMAVSVIDSFSELFELLVLFAMSTIALLLFQIFRNLSDFYAVHKQYSKNYRNLHDISSLFPVYN
jgi:hypothetical protein